MRYSMVIQWSVSNQAYLVTVPELPNCKTYGNTQEEAVEKAQKAIEAWIENARARGEAIPSPRLYGSAEEEGQ